MGHRCFSARGVICSAKLDAESWRTSVWAYPFDVSISASCCRQITSDISFVWSALAQYKYSFIKRGILKNGDSLGSVALNNIQMIRANINVGICLDESFHNNYAIEAAASSTIISEIPSYKALVDWQVLCSYKSKRMLSKCKLIKTEFLSSPRTTISEKREIEHLAHCFCFCLPCLYFYF